MESEPPKMPQPLIPPMGAKVNEPVTFDWEEVADPSSPVSYSLQIAIDKSFTGSSMMLEKTDITKSTYTLTEAETLKLAGKQIPYYWRIKAIDAAQNEGDWTGAGEFYIAQPFALTGWLLYLAIGIGALIIFLLGIWIGRRTAFYY